MRRLIYMITVYKGVTSSPGSSGHSRSSVSNNIGDISSTRPKARFRRIDDCFRVHVTCQVPRSSLPATMNSEETLEIKLY